MSKPDEQGIQAFQRSGRTGQTRPICPPGTAEQARDAVLAERQRLPQGSSDSFEVRKPRW
jgi:hypothetical protein